jgi:hypothetical protein
MTALPQNSTSRFFFDYVTGDRAWSKAHTMQFRPAGGGSDPGGVIAQRKFHDFLNAFGASNLLEGWKVQAVRFQAGGTNFSVPVAISTDLSTFIGTGIVTGYTAAAEAVEATFQARSLTTGRRVDVSLYGHRFGLNDNMRYTSADSGAIANAVVNLNDDTDYAWGAVDGSAVYWYPYMNVNNNSYWESELRG